MQGIKFLFRLEELAGRWDGESSNSAQPFFYMILRKSFLPKDKIRTRPTGYQWLIFWAPKNRALFFPLLTSGKGVLISTLKELYKSCFKNIILKSLRLTPERFPSLDLTKNLSNCQPELMRKEVKIKAKQECIYSTNIYRVTVRTKALQGAAEGLYYWSYSPWGKQQPARKTNSTCFWRMHTSKFPPPGKGIQTSEPGCPSSWRVERNARHWCWGRD